MLALIPLAMLVLTLADDPPAAQPTTPLDLVTAIESVMSDAIAKAEPSIVAIDRTRAEATELTLAIRGKNPANAPMTSRDRVQPGMLNFRLQEIEDFERDYISFDYGSGVVIGDKGEILTAFHVVKGASRIRVKAIDRQIFDAEVIAADPRSDLAVIAPREGATTRNLKLKPIALGDATKLRKGSFLVALGNPYNAARDGRASASWGILSNFARKIEAAPTPLSATPLQLRHYPTLLQLDSKLNVGMSGGAVINMRGELVGLTTTAANAGGFDSQAGYAIPIDKLGRRVVETLRDGREAEYGFLGISLPEDGSSRVGATQANGPASIGGLVVNDEIIDVGGIKVTDAASLVAAVNVFAPGVPIPIQIRRGGLTVDKTIILAKFPTTGEIIATTRPPSWRGIRVDYLSMMPNAEFGGVLFEAMSRGGVFVREVEPGSPADDAGLKTGQIIRKVGETPLITPIDFAKAVKDHQGDVTLETEGNRKIVIPGLPAEKQ